MKSDFLIIGGGVAGLSAANHLAETGASVTLLEGGAYPSHKVCGEFLSPEALPILNKWGITPGATIKFCQIITPNGEATIPFPENAASMSRYQLDDALATRARRFGAIIRESSQVKHFVPPNQTNAPFTVTLTSGEHFEAPTLMISIGKLLNSFLPDKKPKKFPYIGVKAHFSDLEINHLVMCLMPGAYFGMAPIGEGNINVAGIIRCSQEECQDPQNTLRNFLQSSKGELIAKKLQGGKCLFDEWMVTPVPEFGIRSFAPCPRLFFLGDAIGTIPPASGNGLAMGLTSGIMAADYALADYSEKYSLNWQKEYYWRIQRGKWLHKYFLSTHLSKTIPWVANALPRLAQQVFNLTRGKY